MRTKLIKEKLFLIFYGKKHSIKKWEVSIIKVEDDLGKKYKVTRRIPELKVAETKVFRAKEDAKKQFEDWLK